MILTLEERLAVVAELDRSLRGVFVDRGERGVLLRNARNALADRICLECYHYRTSNANGTNQGLCAKVSYKLPDGTTSNVIDRNGSCWLWEHLWLKREREKIGLTGLVIPEEYYRSKAGSPTKDL
jgi:hypothetical protein